MQKYYNKDKKLQHGNSYKKDFERHYYALKNVLGSVQLMTYLEQKQIFVCQKKIFCVNFDNGFL